jgi:hypothetical protein
VDRTEVFQRPGQAERAGKPAFDLCRIEAAPSATRARTVRRSPLIERLARDNSRPIMSVVEATGRPAAGQHGADRSERDGRDDSGVQQGQPDHGGIGTVGADLPLGVGRGHARVGHRDGQRNGSAGRPQPLSGAPSGLVLLVGQFGMLVQVLIKASWPTRKPS